MTIVTISITQKTSIVCGGSSNTNESLTYYNGACYSCIGNLTWPTTHFNSSDGYCHNDTTNTAGTLAIEYTGSAYNASKDLKSASILPTQFASIIIIVILIVGVLSLLALIGYNTYQKMKQ